MTPSGNEPVAGISPAERDVGQPSLLLRTPVVCLLLILLVAVTYFPAVTFDFAHMDDGAYIRMNPIVLGGFNSRTALDAFQVFHREYWVPVLWFSFMLDTEVFGIGAAGFHFTNILLHALNVLLVFFLMRRLTKSQTAGFVTAALFAVHPQRVESVAWITARKDVLLTPFLLLSVFAYLRFVQSRKMGQMAQVCLFQILSLMAKPAAITLPGLLLALDIWPLRRWRLRRPKGLDGSPAVPFKALLLEKAPVITIAVGWTIMSVYIQRQSIYPVEEMGGWIQRVGMSCLAFLVYLKNLIWPSLLGLRFSVSGFPPFEITLGIVLFSALCFGAVLISNRLPHLTAGWFWFVAALAPVSGIVAAGSQWLSDRFTYVPHILLIGAFVVTGQNLVKGRKTLTALSLAAMMALTFVWADQARKQLWTWKDPLSLAKRAVAIAPWHYYALQFLGQAYIMVDDPEKAVETFREVIAHVPEDNEVHYRLAYAYSRLKRFPEAAQELRETIRLKPEFADAYYHLGEFLMETRDYDEAARMYEAYLRMVPDFLEKDYLHSRIGYARLQIGQAAEAAREFRLAVELNRTDPQHHFNLALALFQLGRPDEALAEFRTAAELDPEDLQTRLTLGETLFALGMANEARAEFEWALGKTAGKAEESFAKGRLLEMAGDRAGALAAYREGLGRKPVVPKVMENLEDSVAALGAGAKPEPKPKQ